MTNPITKSFGSPVETWLPVSLVGPFRDNVLQFLLQCAERKDYDLEGMSIWVTYLKHKKRDVYIPLYIVEENVKHSYKPLCGYCAPAGWSDHFLSKKKYHFIIPATDEWDNPLDEGTFDLQTHLLYGLIHSDGYGHLICINGIEGGSVFVSGREIMDLWDSICRCLHVRKISVCDLSRKDGMDLRLLYGVSYGNSWFSRWGYRLCHGSFGSNEDDYVTAMDIFNSFELDRVIDIFSPMSEGTIISDIIHIYSGMSDTMLTTIRDLFGFMLGILPTGEHSAYPCTKGPRYREFSDIARNSYSRWNLMKHEKVASYVAGCLIKKGATNGNGMMTRQEILDKANVEIDDIDPELIDHVLKVMNNVIVENSFGAFRRKYIVRRALNGLSKTQEYRIYDFKGGSATDPYIIPGLCVLDDIIYLYKSVLCGSGPIGHSVKVIIQNKHLIKNFVEDDNTPKFSCWVASSECVFNGISLGEFRAATLDDLKIAVQKEMRETYVVAENVMVSGVGDVEVLSGSVKEITMRCGGMNLESELRFQGGTQTKKLNCKCGAKKDDGEKMVMCFKCEVWEHTLCLGFEDKYPLDNLEWFVCDQCEPYLPPPICNPFSEDGDMEY